MSFRQIPDSLVNDRVIFEFLVPVCEAEAEVKIDTKRGRELISILLVCSVMKKQIHNG